MTIHTINWAVAAAFLLCVNGDPPDGGSAVVDATAASERSNVLEDTSAFYQESLRVRSRYVKRGSKKAASGARPTKCSIPLTYRKGRNCTRFSTEDLEKEYSSWPYLTALCKMDFFNGQDQCLWQECVHKKNPAAGAKQYLKNIAADNSWGAQAAYCWSSGMCTDGKLAINSTLAEAETVCTEKYGERWKHVLVKDIIAPDRSSRDRTRRDNAGLASCAMGSYHCDTAYCQMRFCTPKYGALYSVLANLAK